MVVDYSAHVQYRQMVCKCVTEFQVVSIADFMKFMVVREVLGEKIQKLFSDIGLHIV